MKERTLEKPKALKKVNVQKVKRLFLGMRFTDGLLYKIIIYTLLVAIGFVYLYPILYMVSQSLMDLEDLLNPLVSWIPTKWYGRNLAMAYKVLDYFPTLGKTLLVTLVPALLQTAVSSVIGYGFAKFDFPLKKTFLVIILATFIIPPQVLMIPKYVLFHQFGLLDRPLGIILPAFLGQGLNSAIFIFIFYQFFRMIPKSLDEAAEIDGANNYYIFFRIAIPLATPSFITSFLFSFVWYWNETYMSSLILGNKFTTLLFKLSYFTAEFENLAKETGVNVNEGIRMAAMLFILLPVLLVYFFLQRYFVEGIDRTGITGE